MKVLLIPGILVLLLSSLALAEPPPPRLAVDLVDGSRVIGTPESNAIRVRTDFAELSIPLDRIDTVPSRWKSATLPAGTTGSASWTK